MSVCETKLKLAVNPELIDKNETGNTSLFAEGWINSEFTPAEFIEAIRCGWAYCAQLTGSRKTGNFKASNIASVDVDRGLTIEQALASPLVREHALLIYTTGRHTAQAPRFRIVFRLVETMVCARRMRAVNRGLTRRLGGDMTATDATRISYGNSAAEVHFIGGEVGPELVRELVADTALPEDTGLPVHEIVSRRSVVALGLRQELRLADGRRMLLCDAPPKTAVHCPVHPDENASAFVIHNRHGVPGVYCSACSKTYWPHDQRQDEYDPDDFVKTARQIAAIAEPMPPESAEWSIESVFDCERLAGCRVHLVSGQAAPAKLLPGITLVRSDKGTGKTEAMKRLAARVEDGSARGPSTHTHPGQLQAAGSVLLPRPENTDGHAGTGW